MWERWKNRARKAENSLGECGSPAGKEGTRAAWILLGSERSAGGLLGGEGDPKEREQPELRAPPLGGESKRNQSLGGFGCPGTRRASLGVSRAPLPARSEP